MNSQCNDDDTATSVKSAQFKRYERRMHFDIEATIILLVPEEICVCNQQLISIMKNHKSPQMRMILGRISSQSAMRLFLSRSYPTNTQQLFSLPANAKPSCEGGYLYEITRAPPPQSIGLIEWLLGYFREEVIIVYTGWKAHVQLRHNKIKVKNDSC